MNEYFINHKSFLSTPIDIGDSQFKVLHLKDCKAVEDALQLVQSRAFCDNFKRDSLCFIIVIEIEASLTALDDLEPFERAFDSGKPLIISFESTLDDSINNVIIFKEVNEKIFKKFDRNYSLEKDPSSSFDLASILHISDFNGKLLETHLNVQHNFGNMQMIDRAACNNNVLCLMFLRLFDFDLSIPKLHT